MPRRHALAVTALACVMALFGVAGHSRISGPVILTLTKHHGVHLDDLIVVACWAVILLVTWKVERDDD